MSGASYPFDTTGVSPDNLVTGELHTVTAINAATYRILIPTFAPFYLHNLKLEHVDLTGVARPLVEGVDFYMSLPYMAATRSTGQYLYGGLALNNDLIEGTVRVQYQTIGGDWCADAPYVYERLLEAMYNSRVVWWDQVTDKQSIFPPVEHTHDAGSFYGHLELLEKLETIRMAILSAPTSAPASYIRHLLDMDNPHSVNKADVGLENVPNLELATDSEVSGRVFADKFITLRQVLILLGATPSSGGAGGAGVPIQS